MEVNLLPKSWNSSSKASNSSFDLRKKIGTKAWSQSCAQTRFWTMSGESELRNGSSMRPPILNTDSEAIVETGIANTSHMDLYNQLTHLLCVSFHSHLVLVHLVNQHKSNNHTTWPRNPSLIQPSHQPLHSHKFQKKKNFKNVNFFLGSRITTTYKRWLILSTFPQYLSNLDSILVAMFFKRWFWDLLKWEIFFWMTNISLKKGVCSNMQRTWKLFRCIVKKLQKIHKCPTILEINTTRRSYTTTILLVHKVWRITIILKVHLYEHFLKFLCGF